MFSVLQAKLFGQSRYAKWALFSSFAQMILIIALESIVYTMHTSKVAHIEDISVISKDLPKDSYNIVFLNAKSMSVYHILFIISQIFQFVLCVDALYHENTIQLIALSLFSVGILSYSAIQIVQSLNLLSLQSNNSSDSQPIKSIDDHFDELQYPKLSEIPYEVAILIIMTFFACGFAYLAYKLYKEFGWSIYKRIGADMNMRGKQASRLSQPLKILSISSFCMILINELITCLLDRYKMYQSKMDLFSGFVIFHHVAKIRYFLFRRLHHPIFGNRSDFRWEHLATYNIINSGFHINDCTCILGEPAHKAVVNRLTADYVLLDWDVMAHAGANYDLHQTFSKCSKSEPFNVTLMKFMSSVYTYIILLPLPVLQDLQTAIPVGPAGPKTMQ
ncbi:hypothetical protein G9A89_004998 [Geosiphon pyriformis]|nr:hypothetical protein G9A89_004998 [Geosiphon pyriformis]